MSVYLIPCNLSESPLSNVLPNYVLQDVILRISIFMVENLRTARRFLKKVDKSIDIDALSFCEIGKNANPMEIEAFFEKYRGKQDIGILSEAGCPGVADPGASVVAIAHRRGVQVIPLVGASSLLLSLMGSGFNGQSFTFHGYLPVQKGDRLKTLRHLETEVRTKKQTQLFIETPFRNMQLLEAILETCHKDTKLCIACNLTAEDEFIVTKKIQEWKKALPNLHKKPTVFLLG
ncbi:MAG: SAM-dependent methyltransferase [Flavobacteriaceae bacterium]|nr:SAM-dependent methyltransferase [Flavobacteriaceae bacterium]